MNTQWSHAASFRKPYRGPLPQAIADQLRRRIATGDLPAGSRLPSLRSLAAAFGVSLPTMHAAIQALVALGFVRVHHGIGTFVARPTDGPAVLQQAYRDASVNELVAVRSVLDERLAMTAAERVARAWRRRVPAMLDVIGLYARERAAERHSYPEDFLRADARMHRTLGASVRGFEIAALVRSAIDTRLRDAFLPVADVLAADDELQQMHVTLATAVLDGRPMEAGRLARRIAAREADALGKTLG